MTRLPVPDSGSYRRMGEGLGARPQALLNAGPVLAVPCPGGGRGYAHFIFSPVRASDFLFFCRALAKGRDRQNVAANFRHIAWNLAVAGFHFRNISIRCEQSCSDSPLARGVGSTTEGARHCQEGGNVRVRSVPAICRRSHALGLSIQKRGREADLG